MVSHAPPLAGQLVKRTIKRGREWIGWAIKDNVVEKEFWRRFCTRLAITAPS